MVQAKKMVFLVVQLEHISRDKYYEVFKALVAVVETYGGTLLIRALSRRNSRSHSWL